MERSPGGEGKALMPEAGPSASCGGAPVTPLVLLRPLHTLGADTPAPSEQVFLPSVDAVSFMGF